MEKEFKEHLEALSVATSNEEKEKELLRISTMLGVAESRTLYCDSVQSGTLIQMLALAMRENMQWAKRTPQFISNIPLYVYFELQWRIPQNQTLELVASLKEYLRLFPSGSYVRVLRHVVRPFSNKLLFLGDDEFFNIVRRAINNKTNDQSVSSALLVLLTATDQCTEWQYKILESRSFISELLQLETREEIWSLLGNVVQHPDAKTLLPPEVLERASVATFPSCTDICAILCSESGATSLTMTTEYITSRVKELDNLLNKKTVFGKYFRFNLVELILPFVNLSVADANKEVLGRYVIQPLLRVVEVTRDTPLISNIEYCLERAKQEATKALWNLAFLPANQIMIREANGISTLEAALLQTQDAVMKNNISGILYMLSEAQANGNDTKSTIGKQANGTNETNGEHSNGHASEPPGGHIMISYNWANQPIILKLASSLKERGYNIWLDVEQMEGSTLGAMADAIERSEVVLLCMSQKYKDSPNCRLEGEYSAKRRVDCVPLLMQQNYTPDGWLGIVLGSKLYYPFTDDADWNAKVATLVKAIGNRGKVRGKATNAPITPKEVHQQAPVTPQPRKSVKEWTNKDMLEWMKAEGIEDHYDAFNKHKFDGRALHEVRTLLLTPQLNVSSFLEYMFDKLVIVALGDVFRITAALRNLPQ